MSNSAVAAWGALIKYLTTLVDLPKDCADDTQAYKSADLLTCMPINYVGVHPHNL
jgi:hypothetical protein